MPRKPIAIVLLSAALVLLAVGPSAFADKGGQGKGRGNPGNGASHGSGNGGGHGDSGNHGGNESKGKGSRKFESSQRSAIQDYYRDDYSRSGNCPPGLAKKDNGCLPPGQAKRRWDVGQALPPDIELYPLPPALRATLAPPLPGYDYGYADGGVILFGTSDRVVVDFVLSY